MSAEATITNDVQVEDLGPTKKRLTITIPAEAINEKIDDSIATLAAETTLPGFRKGRAPRQLLERRFGDAVRGETKNQLIADAYATAIDEHEIKPIGDPEPAGDTDLEELDIEHGKPLTFAVEVEVMPEFDLPELEGIEIKKPTMEITDEMINTELERQQIRGGDMKEIAGPFEAGDRIVGTATATKKGENEPFFTHDQVVIAFPDDDSDGEGQVLGLLIEGLDKLLKGKVVGDEFDIETTGPENHEREDIRGADITIHYTITDGYRVTPATVEQLVELFNLGSEDILREQVRLALEQRRDIEVAEAMRSQVYEYLNERVDFELPERLSESQVTRAIERSRMEMLYRGMTEDEVEHRLAEMRSETAERAQSRLKMMMVMNRLAEHYEVEVNEQEVNGRVAQIAMERGERPEKLRNALVQNGQIQQIAGQIREEKAADRVVTHAKVTEVTVDEWSEIIEANDEGSSKKKSTKKKTTKKPAAASSE